MSLACQLVSWSTIQAYHVRTNSMASFMNDCGARAVLGRVVEEQQRSRAEVYRTHGGRSQCLGPVRPRKPTGTGRASGDGSPERPAHAPALPAHQVPSEVSSLQFTAVKESIQYLPGGKFRM